MDIGKRKEQFNLAYVHAMAAHAGLNPSVLQVDDDSVDINLNGRNFAGLWRNPMIQLQLKCSSRDLIRGDYIRYPLSIKNYDDLRGNDVLCPRYLVVLLVPGEHADWIEHHDEFMSLRNACYWFSLRDYPSTANETTVTVSVPLSQRLITSSLMQLMTLASNGESA